MAEFINAKNVGTGNIIRFENRLWKVLKVTHTQPGKGGAYAQIEMKAYDDIGTKKLQRFASDDKIEKASLEERLCKFLYRDGADLVFMDEKTYEQMIISDDIARKEISQFLLDGMSVSIIFNNEDIVGIELPESVVMTVLECDPVVKGQTASSSYKTAVLENNIKITVPPHIKIDDKVVVRTSDCTYLEKAK